MNGLMICHRIRLPYRVMRCMSDAGVDVHVLGNPMSRGLRFSRACESFTLAKNEFDGTFNQSMADEINELTRQKNIEMVFPGCALASRSFHGVKHLLDAKSFPGPDLDQFDLLNNKWEFTKLCLEQNILCPKSVLIQEKQELVTAIKQGEIELPTIVKPLSMDGERGVMKLTRAKLEEQLDEITYAPLLLQEFIEGEDIGSSVFCKAGEIVAYLAHHLKDGVYKTFKGLEILASIQKIASKFKLDGVYNFDMRLAPDGAVYFLECNPRFFFKMPLSLAAGINFALPGVSSNFQSLQLSDTLTRTPRSWSKVWYQPWTMTSRDKKLTSFLLSDPVSFVRELVHLDWD